MGILPMRLGWRKVPGNSSNNTEQQESPSKFWLVPHNCIAVENTELIWVLFRALLYHLEILFAFVQDDWQIFIAIFT